MPLVYSPLQVQNPQPVNFTTDAKTTGLLIQNVSPLALTIVMGLGSIEIPPWQVMTLEAIPNDNIAISGQLITAVPAPVAEYVYVDMSYLHGTVSVQGSGLFFPFMAPGGNAIAAGIMGPDGLQVGTSTSAGSSLLTQLTGSNVPSEGISDLTEIASGTINVGTNQYPQSAAIAAPATKFTRFVVVFHNASGETISSLSVISQAMSFGAYNGSVTLLQASQITLVAGAVNAASVAFWSTRTAIYPWLQPNGVVVQFNLSAAPTAGTIDWALYGY